MATKFCGEELKTFHAQVRVGPYNQLNPGEPSAVQATQGYSTETRTRALDTMPFGRSLRVDMEVWHWKECEMDARVGCALVTQPATGGQARRGERATYTFWNAPEHYRQPGDAPGCTLHHRLRSTSIESTILIKHKP